MKRLFLVILLSVFAFECFPIAPTDTIYSYLLELIDEKETYTEIKEEKIENLKEQLKISDLADINFYNINYKIYNEYKVYNTDSAVYYVRKNIELAGKMDDKTRIFESKLDLAALYIQIGMYLEAVELLGSVDKDQLPDWLLVKYFDNNKQLYRNYSQNNPNSALHIKNSQIYRDSLLDVLDSESIHYKIVYAEKLYDENKLDEAKHILQELLDNEEDETHLKAVLAYGLAEVYKKENNIEQQKKYYAISAINDIKNAIKENASMRCLANLLYEEGDLKNAYRCIHSSMEDAIFSNARVRTYEVSQIFPIIDSAYKEQIDNQKKKLQLFLILVSILSIFLIGSLFSIYRHTIRLSKIRKQLSHTNQELTKLNEELHATNSKLNDVNSELSVANNNLSESNHVKEAYIGHFLYMCSTYIDKLGKFQIKLSNTVRDKKLNELNRILDSREMIDNELKDLFKNFDTTFLHLYPNFVEEFNSLLIEEERFQMKNNELLNVELRIFALIRLGITDSSKIASFLNYSANTIYTYRTRVKNKAAVPREDFEDLVMKIGTLNR